MEEEQSILDATEYVLMALNNIKNFEEFIEYKEEITKAIYDIRNSITNIINMKKYNINDLNQHKEKVNSNDDNTSSISSILGLKFNYDAYLKDIQIQNFYQNEPVIKNNLNQESQNDNLNLKIINNDNLTHDNIINNNISNNASINNNLGFISFQEENNNLEQKRNNEDNIAYNKSIRNKFKLTNNSNENNLVNKKQNSILDNNINNFPENICQNPKENYSNNIRKGTNKKEKLSLIADIIMKINSEDYFYEILTKLFGEDLTDKLMSSDVSDELLDAVQNSIKEIEELKRKDDLKNQNQNNNIHKSNSEEMEEKPKRFPIEQIMNPNIKKQNMNRSSSNKKLNNEKNKNYQEFNFQNNLRKQSGQENFGKNNKKNNSSKKEKPFISATSAYGNYFDPPLQKGGLSKLDEYKKS